MMNSKDTGHNKSNRTRPSAERPIVDVPQPTESHATLEQVGMSEMELSLLWPDANGQWRLIPAVGEVYVDLASESARGIHMSRLYTELVASLPKNKLEVPMLASVLKRLVESQNDLSTQAEMAFGFYHSVWRKALLSDSQGIRNYPVQLRYGYSPHQEDLEVGFKLLYSSTCPCSAALAEQAQLSEQPANREAYFAATPHAQRSQATLFLRLSVNGLSDLVGLFNQLINEGEAVLATPVQTAVKRVDEQEFARLNAQNLMFCEDASRRLKLWLDQQASVADYWVEVKHFESLHPHNATSRSVKRVPGGYRLSEEPRWLKTAHNQ